MQLLTNWHGSLLSSSSGSSVGLSRESQVSESTLSISIFIKSSSTKLLKTLMILISRTLLVTIINVGISKDNAKNLFQYLSIPSATLKPSFTERRWRILLTCVLNARYSRRMMRSQRAKLFRKLFPLIKSKLKVNLMLLWFLTTKKLGILIYKRSSKTLRRRCPHTNCLISIILLKQLTSNFKQKLNWIGKWLRY